MSDSDKVNIEDFFFDGKIAIMAAEWNVSECDSFIYSHGLTTAVVSDSSSAIQAAVEKLTKETGFKHDFSMSAGRAIIKRAPVKIGTVVWFNKANWFPISDLKHLEEMQAKFVLEISKLKKNLRESELAEVILNCQDIDCIDIDRKYSFTAINPCSGNVHSERDAVLFLAKDKAFLEGALPGYRAKCIELGANPAHIESIDLLIARVADYQKKIESKIPDTDLPCEIRRCVDGEGVQ